MASVVLLAQPLHLRLDLSRRGDLSLRANSALFQQSERWVEPEPLEGDPEHHEEQGLDGEAVVQLEHAERWAA